jgi:hypothetical protein
MAVSHLHVHYSRLAQPLIFSATLMALVMLLLAAADRRAERAARCDRGTDERVGTPTAAPGSVWTLLVLAGVVAGLSQYFYHASRVVPLVAAPLLANLLKSRRASLGQVLGFLVGAAVSYGPLGVHHLYHPELLYGRFQTVSVFRPEAVQATLGPGSTLPQALPALLAEQIRRVLSLFVRSGDGGGFYFEAVPGFDAITACLLWLGMGAALARFRRFHELALLLWFWLGVLFGGVFTIDAPSGQRLLIMVTTVYLFGGLLVARAWELLRSAPLRQARWLLLPLGSSAALLLLALNVTIYFVDYAPRASNIQATVVARELSIEPARYHAYLLTDPVFYPNHGAVRFIARDVEAENLKSAADFRPPPPDGLGIVVIALEHRFQDLKSIEARVPGGSERRFQDPVGRLVYVAYRVPPTAAMAGP